MMFSDLLLTIQTESRQLSDDIGKVKIFIDNVLPVQLALTPNYIKRVIFAYVDRRRSGIEYDGQDDSDVAVTLMAAIGTMSTPARDEEGFASQVTKWHYLGYLQKRSTQALVLAMLFFKYRVQSRQAEVYSQLLQRGILDLQQQGPIDQDSALAAWTLVHIQAEQLSWDMGSLIITCQSLPIPDAEYIQIQYGPTVWDLFLMRTLHAQSIADSLVNSTRIPDWFLTYYHTSADISSLISLTWHIGHAINNLREKHYNNIGNTVTATLKEYLKRAQNLPKAERRIRFHT
ncbi:hypothetical protein VFPPC_16858 [Pochonia chlamydosporia 170]|uniref:Uncharacterized protein n=1 Tax=Pochonia chlamydosporia 170 TaxID=1380566 RepID=A0A179F3K9_METCM|nr:hypothetical protein VFPPC_16858 [Pochonia chlamydosporia 170]OAQ59753.1 hypothetical protein VFPPC_16858 [Pochonia chlamydosporia 170]